MKSELILCQALLLTHGLCIFSTNRAFAQDQQSPASTNSQPQKLAGLWKRIEYRFPEPNEQWDGRPTFSVSSGEQYSQVSRGLRLDIMGIVQGFRFFKTNAVTARMYRANGEVIEPTMEGRKLLRYPVSTSWSGHLPNGEFAPEVLTYFPWGPNTLAESWIEVTIPPERYWLEIPYGFDRNPADPIPSGISAGPPQFSPAMKSLTEHVHIVRWENVEYDLARRDHFELSLKQANPFDAESEVVLYSDISAWRLDTPKTAVRVLETDGTVANGVCVNLHLNDNHWRRTDTFAFGRHGDGLRCYGQIEIRIDDKTYQVKVPSSLYKYTHGHPRRPANIDLLANLRVGMTLEEVNQISRNYFRDGILDNAVIASPRREYRCIFKSDASEVTLQFDESERLVSWK